jgi:hypothetical protein
MENGLKFKVPELTPEEIEIEEQNIKDEIHCIVADIESGQLESVEEALAYIKKYLFEPAHDLTTTFDENDLKLLEEAKVKVENAELKTKIKETIESLRALLQK